MAFWHSSPLLSDSITGKAKLWPPSAYHNTYRVPQHSSEHFDARQCSVTRGAGTEWMKSGRFITNFWVLSPTPPVTWNRRDYYLSCPHFFRPYFARFILFPSHFCTNVSCWFLYQAHNPNFLSFLWLHWKIFGQIQSHLNAFQHKDKIQKEAAHLTYHQIQMVSVFPSLVFTLHNIHNLKEHLVYNIIG